MSQVEDPDHYYSKRHLAALEMAEAATDPAARNIHLEMARQYKRLAGAEDSASPDHQPTDQNVVQPADASAPLLSRLCEDGPREDLKETISPRREWR